MGIGEPWLRTRLAAVGAVIDRAYSTFGQFENIFRNLLACGAIVATFGSNVQLPQTARRNNFHLNFAPCAVFGRVRRKVADDVLVLQLDGYFLANISEAVAMEGISSG